MKTSLIILIALLCLCRQNPAAEVYGGSGIQEIYRIRLDRGDLLLETIVDAIRTHQIHDGAVLTAAGSLSDCTYHRVKSLAAKAEDEFITVKAHRNSEHQRINRRWRTAPAPDVIQPAWRVRRTPGKRLPRALSRRGYHRQI